MKGLNIVVDVDDVLRDFNGALLKQYNELYKDNIKLEDIVGWEWIEHLPHINSLYEFVSKYRGEILIFAPPLPTAIQSLYELHDMGHEITIATHQFHDLEGCTLTWLAKNDVPYDNIFFGKNKYYLKGDVMIDDKFRNLQKFKLRNRESMALLMDKPWNKTVPPCYTDDNGITEYISMDRISVFRDALYKVVDYEKFKSDKKI